MTSEPTPHNHAPPAPSKPAPLYAIKPLATFVPPSLSRAWHSAPHPHLPLVATSCSDKTVRVYSLLNFRQHSKIEGGHKRSIRASAWKHGTAGRGESVLATGSFDSSAGIWRRYERGAVERLAENDLMGDENGDEDEEEDDEWNFSVVLDGHESEIKSLAWSAGGQYLATCSRDKSVWVWEELEDDEFETVAVLQDHEADVKCVVWHPEEDLLASCSYDDSIRLYKDDGDDWTCVSLINGHDSTVWHIDFEPVELFLKDDGDRSQWIERRKAAGPRLVSASADGTVRIWRRVPKEGQGQPVEARKIPSVIRTSSAEETWVSEATLPKTHDREVYSVAWSKTSGRIVTTGGDGRIVVYNERWKSGEDIPMVDGEAPEASEWVVGADIHSAHGVFEVNHVAWARRWDRDRISDTEEIIISTGDDGGVKAWTVESLEKA